MNRIFLLVILIFILSGKTSLSQDIFIKRTINTREFELRANLKNQEQLYEACNKIILASDTTFYANGIFGSDLVSYKDILSIDIKTNKRRTWEGIWKGALTGGIAGIIGAPLFKKIFYPGKSDTEGLAVISMALIQYATIFTGCTIAGTAIGGLIGTFSFNYNYYDLTNYNPEQRKREALSIFLNYKIGL